MGKYTRKAKATADLAVLEADAGVRTRAAALESGKGSVGASYLHLRSRLLIRRPQGRVARCAKARRRTRRRRKGEGGAEEAEGEQEGKKMEEADDSADTGCGGGGGGGGDGMVGMADSGEPSCGDNALELEGRERSTRGTTQCSLTKGPDDVRTPGSTNKPACLIQTNRRLRSSDCGNIPSTHEMDGFFAGAEEGQQKTFINKYNFDPGNEKPLPGRFKWEKLDPGA